MTYRFFSEPTLLKKKYSHGVPANLSYLNFIHAKFQILVNKNTNTESYPSHIWSYNSTISHPCNNKQVCLCVCFFAFFISKTVFFRQFSYQVNNDLHSCYSCPCQMFAYFCFCWDNSDSLSLDQQTLV